MHNTLFLYDNFYDKSLRLTPVDKNNNCARHVIESRFFAEFIKAVISFFKTGEIPVSRERIMRTVSVMQSAEASLKKPFEWVNID